MTYVTHTFTVPARTRFNNLTNEVEVYQPARPVTVLCQFDMDAILEELAIKAARSTSGRSYALGGKIKVKVQAVKAVKR